MLLFVNFACLSGEFSSDVADLLSHLVENCFFLGKGVDAIDDAQKLISPDIVLICRHTLTWELGNVDAYGC